MLHYTVNQRSHWACQQYGHFGGTRGWLGVNFACKIHPAVQSYISKQQWVTGFHCVWMVDSGLRWRLSLSGPIQSDGLLIG